jgi:hypothetical protein
MLWPADQPTRAAGFLMRVPASPAWEFLHQEKNMNLLYFIDLGLKFDCDSVKVSK